MDEDLKRQKGLLKAPSARKESTIKRLSSEIKIDDGAGKAAEAYSNQDGAAATGKASPSASEKDSDDKSKEKEEKDLQEMEWNQKEKGVDKSPKAEKSPNEKEAEKSPLPKLNDIGPAIPFNLELELKKYETKNETEMAERENENKMPDIAAEAVRSERENSPHSPVLTPATTENEDTSSFSVVTSDSEQDITLESPHSIDESVKPGHVKDMIAKVAIIAKGGDGVFDEQQCRARFSTSDEGGVEYDRVNQFISLDNKASLCKPEVLSPEASSKSPSDSEEIYVAKTFPELAQVFEPGELKPKKRKSKIEKDKTPKDKADEDKGK